VLKNPQAWNLTSQDLTGFLEGLIGAMFRPSGEQVGPFSLDMDLEIRFHPFKKEFIIQTNGKSNGVESRT
jgi:hypothetical protein